MRRQVAETGDRVVLSKRFAVRGHLCVGLLVGAVLLGGSGIAGAQVGSAEKAIAGVLAQLRGAPASSAKVLTTEDGFVSGLVVPNGGSVATPKSIAPNAEARAKSFLDANARWLGIRDGVTFRRDKPSRRSTEVRLRQYYQDIPVFGGEVIVATTDSGGITYYVGDLLRNTSVFERKAKSVEPAVSPEDAQAAVIEFFKDRTKSTVVVREPDLVVYDPAILKIEGEPTLAWRMNIVGANDPLLNDVCLIDAHTREVVLHYTRVNTARNRRVYDCANKAPETSSRLVRREGDPATSSASNPQTHGTSYPDADQLYDLFGDADAFFRSNFGLDAPDSAGMTQNIRARVCPDGYTSPWRNACWTGDPSSGFWFGTALFTDDVAAHEFTHAITQYTSGLIYVNEPGALNESFSDIFGEFVDFTNGRGNDASSVRWIIGEDLGQTYFRDMKNPPAKSQPDRMGSSLYLHLPPSQDQGGVHTNSGVGNKLCYLITDGGTFNGKTVTGIGAGKAAALFYETLTHKLTESASYHDLYVALMAAANTLNFTATQRSSIESACQAVEIVTGGTAGGPTAPQLLQPANGAYIPGSQVTLKWQTVTGATYHAYQISGSSTFSDSIGAAGDRVSGTSATISGLPNDGRRFYWRVRAYNSKGWGVFSETRSFVNGEESSTPAIDPPLLLSPVNAANVTGASVTLEWAPVSGAGVYDVLLTHRTASGSLEEDGYIVFDESVGVDGLPQDGTEFSWKVSAWSDDWETVSDWSETRTFKSVSSVTLTPPAPTHPLDGTTVPADGEERYFGWNAVTGATKYELEVARDAAFGVPLKTVTLTTTGTDMAGLPTDGTRLYWHVRAGNSTSWSSFSTTRSFISGSSTPVVPAVPTLASPADGASVTGPQVSLTWQASSGATRYALQVSRNDPAFTNAFDIDLGNALAATVGLRNDNAQVYWRVKAGNNAGWSAYTSARRYLDGTEATMAQPTLLAPADASTVSDAYARLGWSAVAGATRYEVQVSPNSGFSPCDTFTTANPNYDYPSPAETATLYWRVRAGNTETWGAYSGVWHFTCQRSVPGTPSLLSPADGATVTDGASVTVNWGAVSGATQYILQTDVSAQFLNPVETVRTTTSAPVALQHSYTWIFWRVKAGNSAGWGAFSAPRQFLDSGVQDLQPPVLLAPTDGAEIAGVQTTLNWSAVTGADGYETELADVSTFADAVNVLQGSTSFVCVVPSTGVFKKYWHVRATKGEQRGPWSPTWSFGRGGGLAVPTHLSPPNDTHSPDDAIVLTWSAVTGATRYTTQLSTDAAFTTPIQGNEYSKASVTWSGLPEDGTRYYWRVRAGDATAWGNWSQPWSFVSEGGSGGLQAPAPISPAHNSNVPGDRVVLTWSSVPGATRYITQLSKDAAFSAPSTGSERTAPTTTWSGLKNQGVQYWWRVRAGTDFSWSEWSQPWSFTNSPEVTVTVPENVAATDGAYNDRVRVTWNAVTGATQYRVFRADSATAEPTALSGWFSGTSYDDFTAQAAQASASGGCSGGTTAPVVYKHYYWVQAKNATSSSDYGGPDSGYRGAPVKSSAHGVVYEKAMPSLSAAADDGAYAVTPLSTLFVRLCSDDAILPKSAWAQIECSTLHGTVPVEWIFADDGENCDGWIVYRPEQPWQAGDTITLTVGARTETGGIAEAVCVFVVERDAPVEPLNDLSMVSESGLPGFEGGVGSVYRVGPEAVFDEAKTIWLPVPAEADPAALTLYCFHDESGERGWYLAEHVTGFLVPGSRSVNEADGVVYLGFDVRYAADVRLGPREMDSAAARASVGDVGTLVLAAGALIFAGKRRNGGMKA